MLILAHISMELDKHNKLWIFQLDMVDKIIHSHNWCFQYFLRSRTLIFYLSFWSCQDSTSHFKIYIHLSLMPWMTNGIMELRPSSPHLLHNLSSAPYHLMNKDNYLWNLLKLLQIMQILRKVEINISRLQVSSKISSPRNHTQELLQFFC
jgi:hypothetical protein